MWKWLRRERILPFLGVSSIPPPFSMVSVWMEKGNIMSFLRTSPEWNPFNLVWLSCLALGSIDSWCSLWM